MPTTLLAVDDSVTMRKVLELTFAGEDFRVITADTADAGLAKLRSERPALALVDVSLDAAGGYALCGRIKAESPATPVILLSSKQQPYDTGKGTGAKADDFVEKPFDTQQLIDKVKRVLARPVAAEPPRAAAPVPAAPPARPTAPGNAPPAPSPQRPAPAAPVSAPAGATTRPAAGFAVPGPASLPAEPAAARGGTLAYIPPMGKEPPSREVPSREAPAAASRASTAGAPTSAAGASPSASLASSINGSLASKLGQLGLTEAQVSGVLALSREVVERVVWEVVPVLAETLIKEELKRLTSD